MNDIRECTDEVLQFWLESPLNTNGDYPVSWEGLYKLLTDLELSEVANELKQAVDSHNRTAIIT